MRALVCAWESRTARPLISLYHMRACVCGWYASILRTHICPHHAASSRDIWADAAMVRRPWSVSCSYLIRQVAIRNSLGIQFALRAIRFNIRNIESFGSVPVAPGSLVPPALPNT